jgi:hypothetical protein
MKTTLELVDSYQLSWRREGLLRYTLKGNAGLGECGGDARPTD